MTILQGTMQDGTVLPVQVDAQGRLVAQGLAGPAGAPGPQGIPGVPGGSFALPPDPQENFALCWIDGALQWGKVVIDGHYITTDVVTAVYADTAGYKEFSRVEVASDRNSRFFRGGDVVSQRGGPSETLGRQINPLIYEFPYYHGSPTGSRDWLIGKPLIGPYVHTSHP